MRIPFRSHLFFYTGKESKQFSRSNLGLKSKGGHTRVKASFLPNHPSFFGYRIDVKLGRERRRKTLYFCPVNDCLYTYLPTTTTSASGRTMCTTRPLCNRLSNLFMNQSRRPVFPPRLSTLFRDWFFLESRFSILAGEGRESGLSRVSPFPTGRASPLSTLVLIDVLIVESRLPCSRASFPSSR